MSIEECELQLNQLIIDWDEDKVTRLNATDIEAIKQLQQENQQLKIQISAREEALKTKEYCKYASRCDELMDCTREEYNDTVEENMRLSNNWNELKKWLEENWKQSQDVWFVKIINKMQELEDKSE